MHLLNPNKYIFNFISGCLSSYLPSKDNIIKTTIKAIETENY